MCEDFQLTSATAGLAVSFDRFQSTMSLTLYSHSPNPYPNSNPNPNPNPNPNQVSYFDRFVSAVSSPEGQGLEKQRVQLLAVTCTRLAAKFAEVKMPSLDDMVEIAQGLFNKTQLKEMELEAHLG